MNVTVRLFHDLRTAIGQSELELEADTLNDVIKSLINQRASVRELLFDRNGELRSQVLYYVNNAVQNPPDLRMTLHNGDIILLIPSALGG